MKKTIIYIFTIHLLLFTIYSCSKDGNRIEIGNEATLSLTLDNGSESTKGAGDPLDNEKLIDKLDIFIYNNSGTQCLYYPEQTQLVINNQTSPISVSIKVPQQIMQTLLQSQNCRIYIIANCNLDRSQLLGLTIDNLKKLSQTNSQGYLFNTNTAPKNFLMESNDLIVPQFIDQLNQNLGKFTLKRAASKIVLDILSANVIGYTPGTTKIRITNYLDKSIISSSQAQYTPISSDFKTSSRLMVPSNNAQRSYSMELSNPIYTYYNDWSSISTSNPNFKETYIVIEMDWTHLATLETKTYYYKIPIAYKDAQGSIINKLVRNYIYQYKINISAIGGISPDEALNINANFDIIDWNTRNVEASILSYHYLFVYDPFIKLQNANTYTWEYKSSLPINYTITKVYSNYYTSDGVINTKTYTQADSQYPIITINPVSADNKTTFTIKSMVPINYVPLYIELKINNGANLSKNVTLTIFPKQYVTAEFSNGTTSSTSVASKDVNGVTNWRAGSYTTPTGSTMDVGSNNADGASGQTNFNFFTISTKSLDISDELAGYRIGDPTVAIEHPGNQSGGETTAWRASVSPYYQTVTTVDGNKIISPEFVIATQRGITSTDKTWILGQKRCNTYREGKYPAGTWRMPTLAELKIIRKMQLDNNSAIKNLFQSSATSGWWSAQQYWDVVVGQTVESSAIRSQTATYAAHSVRCVHDVWRDK